MGGSSSKEPEDDRGVKGFFADIVAANRVAPYFRFEGCQLFFASISAGNLTDATYRQKGLVGVKRVKVDGSDALPGGGYKTLSHRQFKKVLKRMQSEADVALQAQIALRGWVEPDRERAERIMMEDGTIVSIDVARATGALQAADTRNSWGSKKTMDDKLEHSLDMLMCSMSASGAMEVAVEAAHVHSNFEDGGPLTAPAQEEDGGGGEEGEWAAGNEVESAEAGEPQQQVVGAGTKKKKSKKRRGGVQQGTGQGEDAERSAAVAGAEPGGCREACGGPKPLEAVEGVAVACSEGDAARPAAAGGILEEEDAAPCTPRAASGSREGDEAPSTPAGAGGTSPGGGGLTPGGTDMRVAKAQREEYECMICLQTTGSGISLPCLHGPFCEGCLSVWSRHNRSCPCCRRKTGYDDDDCWVHLEEPNLDEIVGGLYNMIRRL